MDIIKVGKDKWPMSRRGSWDPFFTVVQPLKPGRDPIQSCDDGGIKEVYYSHHSQADKD